MESLIKRVILQPLEEWDATYTWSQSTTLSGSLADEAQEEPGLFQPYDTSPGS